MASRRLRERIRGRSVENPPQWLPDGWIMEVRKTRQGNHWYYTSPVSGCTFQSKEEVLRYISVVRHDGGISETASCSDESKKLLAEEAKESPAWLPSGWTLEIKTRMSGKSAGRMYKCYFDPLTRSRFYSKNEVLRFLTSGKGQEQTSEEKKHFNRNSTDNVIAHIEYSPDGLPQGWIKETKFRENNGVVRKDRYYTDPINGYIFHSLKDAIRYVETGYLSKHAHKRKRSVREVHSFKDESPPPNCAENLNSQVTARNCHFTKEILDPNKQLSETPTFPDRLLLPPSSQEVHSKGEMTPEAANLSPPCPVNLREKTKRKSISKLTKKLNEESDNENASMKLEVAEESFEPSDWTLMDTLPKELIKHTKDEANQGEESKLLSAANSNGRSKEESVEVLGEENINAKLPLISKDLLRAGMDFSVATQRAPSEKSSLLETPCKNPTESETDLVLAVGKPSTPDLIKPKLGSRKAKDVNATCMPRRSSRRLAGVEADLVTGMDIGVRACRSKPKDTSDMIEKRKIIFYECPRRKNPMEGGATEPMDQTLMMDILTEDKESGKHTNEEANQKGESQPGPATNSKGKSKKEKEAALEVERVTTELLLVPNETSQDLQGNGMGLVANHKAPVEKSCEPPSKAPLELENEFAVAVGKPSTPDLVKHRGRNAKATDAMSMPRQASQQLARVEADPLTDVQISEVCGTCRSKSKDTVDLLEEPKRNEPPQRQNIMEEGMTMMNQSVIDWPELPTTSPFGDSWPDPCLEFAFKTLTGDLPVLDDAIAIQEYFQQQLFSLDSSSPCGLAPLPNNDKTEAPPGPDGVNLPGEKDMRERSHSSVMVKK